MFAGQTFASQDHPSMSPGDALKLLQEGNERYFNMEFKRPNVNKKKMNELVNGQSPFAVIITCSDSRVPLGHIFDTGLGDVFEIKNAGNLVDNHVLGSVEYAVSHLGTKLVVVMGHTSCGCVATAIEKPKRQTKQINSLIDSVKPAIKLSKNQEGDFTANVTKNNAILNAGLLVKRNRITHEYVEHHGVVIIPAMYDIKTGKVEFYKQEKIGTENL